MLTPYRTTPGASVVTFSVHDPDTGAQTVAPAAATLVATTATLRHYSANVTPPCQVRWYEDGVWVDTAVVYAAAEADLGSSPVTLTITNGAGVEIPGVRVFISTDNPATVRSADKITNSVGQVTFDLTNGESYLRWAYSPLYDFANPQAFIAVAD